MVSPRNSRSKSLCISRRVIGTPRRARNSANMAPPGPPPTMQQEVCWTSTTSLSVCCVCTESAMGGVTESSLVGRSLQTNSSSKDSNGGAIWSILSQTIKTVQCPVYMPNLCQNAGTNIPQTALPIPGRQRLSFWQRCFPDLVYLSDAGALYFRHGSARGKSEFAKEKARDRLQSRNGRATARPSARSAERRPERFPEKLPTIRIDGVSTLDAGPYPGTWVGFVYAWSNNIIKIISNHTVKWGVFIERSGQNDLIQLTRASPPVTNNQNGAFRLFDNRAGGSGLGIS